MIALRVAVLEVSLDDILVTDKLLQRCCQGCLTRRTWRIGRRFRTRMDAQTCPSVLFKRTSACKKFFIIFFFQCGPVGNFSEADVSNQNPRWRRARVDGRGARRRVRVHVDRCGRAQTDARGRKRLRAPAPVCARTQMLLLARIRLPKKWIPVGSAQGLQ